MTIMGLMVKGPQGVGKSYSLVNLTRMLLASRRDLITVIPDCGQWQSIFYLNFFILASVGVNADNLLREADSQRTSEADLRGLIHEIELQLQDMGMKWGFVFGQINRLFARTALAVAKDIGDLPFPFYKMKDAMYQGRILSIVSASANNKAAYRDNHKGFEGLEYPYT